MSKARIKLFADLRQFIGGEPSVDVEITPGETIASVIDSIGVPRERIKVIFLNARSTNLEQTLAGGEEVSVFSAIGGG